MGKTRRTMQPFGIVSNQRGDHHGSLGRSCPRFVQVKLLVWHNPYQTRLSAARRISLASITVLVASYRRMLMAPVWPIKSILYEVRRVCLRHGMILCMQKCAFGSDSMRHKHRH